MMFKSRSYVYNLVVKASFELPGVKIPKHQIAHVSKDLSLCYLAYKTWLDWFNTRCSSKVHDSHCVCLLQAFCQCLDYLFIKKSAAILSKSGQYIVHNLLFSSFFKKHNIQSFFSHSKYIAAFSLCHFSERNVNGSDTASAISLGTVELILLDQMNVHLIQKFSSSWVVLESVDFRSWYQDESVFLSEVTTKMQSCI